MESVDVTGWNYWKTCPETGRVYYSKMDGFEVKFLVLIPTDQILAANEHARKESKQGWKGDVHSVAHMPFETYINEIQPASLQGDKKYIRRWMNNLDNEQFRTKRGRV